jgi:uncharacterized membrane protein YeaQ/YmgE (transglycosylase-associated protein family)
MSLIWFLLLGMLAGWLANQLMNRDGSGLLGNLILGVVGAFIGGPLLGLLGLRAGGFIGSLVTATIGAVVLIWIVRLIRGKQSSA